MHLYKKQGLGFVSLFVAAGLLAALATVGTYYTQKKAATQNSTSPASLKAEVKPNSFQDLNGVAWIYTTQHDHTFADITKSLDKLSDSGFRVVGIYSPYHGDKNKWLGCDPLDFYSTSPQSGSMDDWKKLVEEAHKRNMKVVTYFSNVFIDKESDYFKIAALQYKTGDRTSREVSTFQWTTDPTTPLPSPSVGPPKNTPRTDEGYEHRTQWKYSPEAGAYYWSVWGEAGLDFNKPGARAEIEKLTKYWLDTGVDGFMWDDGHNAMNFQGKEREVFKYHMADLAKTYTPNDKWITFESTQGDQGDAYLKFGLTSWFNFADVDNMNDYTGITLYDDNADSLEDAFKKTDFARSNGQTTHAWASSDPYPSEALMRVQEAALLAGAGILYGTPEYDIYLQWPKDIRDNWDEVLRTVNANKALLPSASRTRVPTNPDPKIYAMQRTSKDGSQTVLLIYNFNKIQTDISVQLEASGLSLCQTPYDLYTKQPAPTITKDVYTIKLPPYGFRMLQVKKSKDGACSKNQVPEEMGPNKEARNVM